jgi:homocysteine S-methyltransferase
MEQERKNNAMESLAAGLTAGDLLLLDGATGTELQRRGASMHGEAWCATATLTDPDILLGVHRDYILAGADIVTTNTFSTNRSMLEPAGFGEQVREINIAAVQLARQARKEAEVARRVVVAGSMSHQVPVVAGCDFRDPAAIPDKDAAAGNFREMADILANAEVDLILLEMMSDPDLALPAIAAARATGLPFWVGLSARLGEDGRLVAYHRQEMPFAESLREIVGAAGDAGVVGIMHTNIQAIAPCLAIIRQHWDGPLMVYPDSGVFRMPEWVFEGIVSPAEFVDLCRTWRDAFGVDVIGGCCGLGIEHIRALAILKNEGRRKGEGCRDE